MFRKMIANGGEIACGATLTGQRIEQLRALLEVR